MKYRILLIFLFAYSCTVNSTKLENRSPYNSKGFAYIFNEQDYKNKVIKGRLDNTKLQISHNQLKPNTLIKIINLKTNDSIILKNLKRSSYPDFYKILITDKVAQKLNLEPTTPFVEILEIKKNKSFIAKKAKIFNEERQISSNAPVTSVKISNISKYKPKNASKDKNFSILIGTFYTERTARFLIERISKELPFYEIKRLNIEKKNDKEINLISGPYNAINLMKNDYIKLKEFGFEDLDIIAND